MRAGRARRGDNVVKQIAVAMLALLAGSLAPAGTAAAHGHAARDGSAPVTVERDRDRIVLSNGFVRARFDLAHPGIDLLQGDFGGTGDYGADLTASGPDAFGRSGIVLERTDVQPARVVDSVGITDTEHGDAGQVPGPVPLSLAAELLPPGGAAAVPPADTHDDVPVHLLDTSGATPNVAVAHGQAFALGDGAAPMRAVHVFGFASDGDAAATVTLRFADGSTETHAVTVPDWGAPPSDADAVHPAFDMPYRRRGTGREYHRFIVYDAVIPVASDQPLAAVVLPDGVPNASTSTYHTQLNVLGLSFERADGGVTAPPLDANDPPPGAGRHPSSAGSAPGLRARVHTRGHREATVRVEGVVDDADDPLVTSTWTLTLRQGRRTLGLDVRARALAGADDVAGIRLSQELAPAGAYGQFARGVTERLNSLAPFFASSSPLARFYALGGGGAVDERTHGQAQTVLRNAPADGASPERPASGIEQVMAGRYPHEDAWDGAGWGAAAPTTIRRGDAWHVSARITPNDRDFPAGGVAARPTLPADDLAAILTGVYATAAGVLDSYALPGLAAPTLATPGWSYGDGRNFYDPDTFIIDSALLWSGDRYLIRQARDTIERSESEMAPSGQIPHHFNGDRPTFVAISGATQTGPNIFWIAAALRYAEATGDYGWLRAHMPAIEQALGFLTDRFDAGVGLVDAPGPLWIDVFIRSGFTADTNAYMVGLLRDVAQAEALTGRDDAARAHRAMSATIARAMNDRLWAGDHYVTELHRDGSTRDFVDYDANLLAVANGVATGERARAVLARVDGGRCTHGRATWVSERTYGPADTYGGNTGDSAVTMGRIGWADAYARVATRDADTFEHALLEPLQHDLLQRTWLTERYDCAGNATRAPYYHEYPEVVVMLLREVAYGIRLGLTEVTIDPLSRRDFHWRLGGTDVAYSARRVVLRVPGAGEKRFEITGLTPGARYRVHGRGAPARVTADRDGTLRFHALLDGRRLEVRRERGRH